MRDDRAEPRLVHGLEAAGQPVAAGPQILRNYYVGELSFAQAFRTKLVSAGFPSGIGMLIDTSRNGWGGTARPTAASTSTVLDVSRVGRRIHAGNWCNQSGAGLGERPQASPATGSPPSSSGSCRTPTPPSPDRLRPVSSVAAQGPVARRYLAAIAWNTLFGSQRSSSMSRVTP
ncbi:glycoside hydrolase family 6 protein [Actinocorallia herbida]|uniref:glycoside hydrolase family 6 protein n=1 Tax=Actinocorallia herbida TaxID=58109 RepID=UPI0026C43CB3